MTTYLALAAGVLLGLALAYWLDKPLAAHLDQYCTMQVWLLEDSFRGR